MSSVVIAKASLAAALLRPDPISCTKEQAAAFHATLGEALLRCTGANIQV